MSGEHIRAALELWERTVNEEWGDMDAADIDARDAALAELDALLAVLDVQQQERDEARNLLLICAGMIQRRDGIIVATEARLREVEAALRKFVERPEPWYSHGEGVARMQARALLAVVPADSGDKDGDADILSRFPVLLDPEFREPFFAMVNEMSQASMGRPVHLSDAEREARKCGCGYPEKPCLRIMLRNGPPFPPRPCEPAAAAPFPAAGGTDTE